MQAKQFHISHEPILSSIVICSLYKTKILSRGYIVGVMWCFVSNWDLLNSLLECNDLKPNAHV